MKIIEAHGKQVQLSHDEEVSNQVPALTIRATCGATHLTHTVTLGSIDDHQQPLHSLEDLQEIFNKEREKIATIAAHREHMRELRTKLV